MLTDRRKNDAVPIVGEGTHKSKNAQPFTIDMLKRGNFDAVMLFVQGLRRITNDTIEVCKSFGEQMNSMLLTNMRSLAPFLREFREADSSLTLNSDTVTLLTQFYQIFSQTHMEVAKVFDQGKQSTQNLMWISNTSLGEAKPNSISLSNSGEKIESKINRYYLAHSPTLRSVNLTQKSWPHVRW